MFKRFSSNYMAMLFLLDGLLIQLCFSMAIRLRFTLLFGQPVKQAWASVYFYMPGISLHVVVGLIWLLSFLALSVYTPRKIIRWIDETQRIVAAHTIAALSLAGLLYLANIELLRLIYLYFYILALAALLGYRLILRLWHRSRRLSSGSVARILVVGAGRVGQEIVAEFQRQQWPGIEFVGFLDDDVTKHDVTIQDLPILGRVDDATVVINRDSIDEVIIALPRRAHIRLVNLVAMLNESPVRVRVVPDYFELAYFRGHGRKSGRYSVDRAARSGHRWFPALRQASLRYCSLRYRAASAVARAGNHRYRH